MVKIFVRTKSSIEQDGDENSSDDISTDDDDDLDHIRPGKTKRTPLLFVCQNRWQRKLFSRYGKELTLLDTTYRRKKICTPVVLYGGKNKCSLPNRSSFVTENETGDRIKEALSIIKSWNKDVSPIYGMTDYCT